MKSTELLSQKQVQPARKDEKPGNITFNKMVVLQDSKGRKQTNPLREALTLINSVFKVVFRFCGFICNSGVYLHFANSWSNTDVRSSKS